MNPLGNFLLKIASILFFSVSICSIVPSSAYPITPEQKPESIVLPVAVLGEVSDIRRKILQNTIPVLQSQSNFTWIILQKVSNGIRRLNPNRVPDGLLSAEVFSFFPSYFFRFYQALFLLIVYKMFFIFAWKYLEMIWRNWRQNQRWHSWKIICRRLIHE